MKVPKLILGQVINVQCIQILNSLDLLKQKNTPNKMTIKMSAHNMLFINCIKICFKMNEFFILLSYKL